jgi:trimeric autotransporter adhesin
MKCWNCLILLFVLPCLSLAQRWQSVGGGTSNYVEALYADTVNHILYVGGNFEYAGDSLVHQIAAWNGSTWRSLGEGTGDTTNGPLSAITSIVWWEENVFTAGANDRMAGHIGWRHLNKWDGIEWENCGNPDGSAIVEIVNGELFAVGLFSEIYGEPLGKLVKWNGERFVSFATELLPDPSDHLYCASYYNGKYYFGGNFDLAGGLEEIASWDGNEWKPVGLGILGDSWVNQLRVFKDLLFVGGEFRESPGNTSDYITVWDGSRWLDPFPNVQYLTQVLDLEIIDGDLYIVGMHRVFDGAAWQGPYMLAKYDGSEFCSFGGQGYHQAMRVAGLDGHLYFSTNQVLHGDTVNYLVEWLGGADDMDICISQPVHAIEAAETGTVVSLFPNPVGSSFSMNLPRGIATCTFKIADVGGRWVLPETKYHGGGSAVDVGWLDAGLYLVEVRLKDRVQMLKIVKQ